LDTPSYSEINLSGQAVLTKTEISERGR